MPLQNRVDPWGNLIAVTARGAWMGNRGALHNAHNEIITLWKRKPWVTCALDFKGRKRQVFGPNTYSELFFLDEATAFSAGHRPCATCRRDRYNAFKEEWIKVNHPDAPPSLPIAEIDKQIHTERIAAHFSLFFKKKYIGADKKSITITISSNGLITASIETR